MNIIKENKQIIEVEYNEEMVNEDKKAIKEKNIELIVQDVFNIDEVEELLGEGAKLIEK